MSGPPSLSVVLPSYNEAANLTLLIAELRERLTSSYEMLVVDDDSPDQTARIVREAFADDPRVRVFVRTSDRGLAASIREGIERSRGDLVLVMDTDFSHDPALVSTLLDRSLTADMVVASRYCRGGGMEPRWYYYFSLAFNRFIDLALGTGLRDNLFGYFVVHRAMLASLPAGDIFYGYGDYFFRLIWHLRASGASIAEVPAFCRARERGQSKSSLVKMLVGYTYEVLKLRLGTPAAGRRRGDRAAGVGSRSA